MTLMTTRAEISHRAAALFAASDDYADDAVFIGAADALAAGLPAGDADGLFHHACARDSRGYPDQAIPLYREALGARSPDGSPAADLAGKPLSPEHRRRAVIQLASSLRNTGQAAAALALLEAERENGPDDLDDALAPHLPRYNRSMANYARALLEEDPRE